VFLVNSCLSLYTVALDFVQGRPFSRSYGANLPSSLERVLLRPLVFSTNLPVSVSGTGFLKVYLIVNDKRCTSFSWKYDIVDTHPEQVQGSGITSSQQIRFSSICIASSASTAFHSQTQFSRLRPSVPFQKSTGISTCLPSTTPVGLALGPDSPSMDEPCRGTLRFSGHWTRSLSQLSRQITPPSKNGQAPPTK